jgi:NACHT domain
LAIKPSAHDSVQHLLTHVLPPWLYPVIAALVGWMLAPPQLAGGLRWFIGWFGKRRSVGDKRRADLRGRFASMMATQVMRVSEAEEWQDEQFTELEAEVEMHGRQSRGLLLRRRLESIRRVPSLSAALTQSSDQIILLEGEPGSGKSVALRHVALRMAVAVKAHPSEHGVIPLYLNLKEFRPLGAVDASAVLDFVLASLKRANVVTVDRFLEEEFERGIEEGTWLFLFDSFDEIPAVLGAVEADDVVAVYADALYDFLTSMNVCRGIIASRDFRGPKRISWPRFHILRLTGKQRKDLIEKLDVPQDTEQLLLSGLISADSGLRQLADNPLFLALLCEYRATRPSSRRAHTSCSRTT